VRGDEAIRVVAHVLRKHVGKPFLACRYGGEEFTVILPGSDGAAAALLAERIRRSVQETLSAERGITVSIGVAGMPDVRFETAEKLFEAADLALYDAKEQGRNRVVSFQAKPEKPPLPRQLAS
jgi:diguanylate cyclase (GGDEF)-like protein